MKSPGYRWASASLPHQPSPPARLLRFPAEGEVQLVEPPAQPWRISNPQNAPSRPSSRGFLGRGTPESAFTGSGGRGRVLIRQEAPGLCLGWAHAVSTGREAGCRIAGTMSGTQRECMRAGRPRSRVGIRLLRTGFSRPYGSVVSLSDDPPGRPGAELACACAAPICPSGGFFGVVRMSAIIDL